MADIREKIAKLLALATSPNEQEAREALLKARELMAKHKLQPEECREKQSVKVVKQMLPRGFKLVADHPKPQKPHTEGVFLIV